MGYGPPPQAPVDARDTRSESNRILFVGPYLIFVVAIYAYPIGYAVYMSLHNYIFTAPGTTYSATVRRVCTLSRIVP